MLRHGEPSFELLCHCFTLPLPRLKDAAHAVRAVLRGAQRHLIITMLTHASAAAALKCKGA